MDTNEKIFQECKRIADFIIKKNNDYGDSLQNPIQVFQKNKIEGILGRIDDKLSRIESVGLNDKTEDTVDDLIGYLIHLNIARKDESTT